MKTLSITALVLFLISILSDANAQDSLFADPVNYAAGFRPQDIFAVDLDNDGDNDLAVANIGSNNVSVLCNNGDSTFQAAVNYDAGYLPNTVVAADFDMDSDIDLVAVNEGSPNVPLFLNNSDGTFQAAIFYSAGAVAHSVCAADLDGDSDIDLAVANHQSNDISILMNLTITTDLDNSPEIILPVHFSLSQNYPNPFNPSTTIEFSIPKSEFITLKIYNLLGQGVEELVAKRLTPGNYKYIWDASDFASGIYYYSIKVGDFVKTKKLLFLK